MINYGNWQDIEKLQGQNQAYANKHDNAFGGLLRAFDPMTYVPGIEKGANAVHDLGGQAVTAINTGLSPIVGAFQKTEPGAILATNINKQIGMEGIDEFVKNKPFDAAALAAATFFSGGAASSAMGAGGTLAAPAASSAGGIGGISAGAGASAITPAFASGAGAAAATTPGVIGGGALTTAAGTGTLGAAGTSAGASLLTPAFASLGGAATGSSSLLTGLKQANSYRSNFSSMIDKKQPDNRSDTLANMIVSSNTPGVMQDKISKQIVMNKFGRR